MMVMAALVGRDAMTQELTTADVLKLPVPAYDFRIAYGKDPLQFGDLRLPGSRGAPVVVVIHGGCWLSRYDSGHISGLSAALTRAGYATWTIEYRRVGNPGGGWPGTFEDVAAAIDHVRAIAGTHALDANRVALLGHSAGGHLALWAAARARLPKDNPLYSRDPLSPRGVVALAPIPDLKRAAVERVCDGAALSLMGGPPEQFSARYEAASPLALLPLGAHVRIIHGKRDRLVPLELSAAFAAAAQQKGDDVSLLVLDRAGHFEPIVPTTTAFRSVESAVRSLLAR